MVVLLRLFAKQFRGKSRWGFDSPGLRSRKLEVRQMLVCCARLENESGLTPGGGSIPFTSAPAVPGYSPASSTERRG